MKAALNLTVKRALCYTGIHHVNYLPPIDYTQPGDHV
jgi:hypothetical protein